MGWESNMQPSPGHQIEAPYIPASIHVQAIATQRSTTRLRWPMAWLGMNVDQNFQATQKKWRWRFKERYK